MKNRLIEFLNKMNAAKNKQDALNFLKICQETLDEYEYLMSMQACERCASECDMYNIDDKGNILCKDCFYDVSAND